MRATAGGQVDVAGRPHRHRSLPHLAAEGTAGRPITHLSDQACLPRLVELGQYISNELALLAAMLQVHLSVGRTAWCWDNALAESFFSTLKNELAATQP